MEGLKIIMLSYIEFLIDKLYLKDVNNFKICIGKFKNINFALTIILWQFILRKETNKQLWERFVQKYINYIF